MIIIFILTSSTCTCYHVTKDRILTATRIHEQFNPERQQRILLGLEPVITTQHFMERIEN